MRDQQLGVPPMGWRDRDAGELAEPVVSLAFRAAADGWHEP